MRNCSFGGIIRHVYRVTALRDNSLNFIGQNPDPVLWYWEYNSQIPKYSCEKGHGIPSPSLDEAVRNTSETCVRNVIAITRSLFLIRVKGLYPLHLVTPATLQRRHQHHAQLQRRWRKTSFCDIHLPGVINKHHGTLILLCAVRERIAGNAAPVAYFLLGQMRTSSEV